MKFFKRRVILSLQNDTINEFNDLILRKRFTLFIEYFTINVVVNIENETMKYLTLETLQSINFVELFSFVLKMIVNVSIMLLRNFYFKKDLCNNIRLIIIKIFFTLLKIKILDDEMHNEIRLLLKITLITLKNNYSFILKRRQFFVKVRFVITINKSQKKSLNTVNVNLRLKSFAHNQLYVALSRVTNVKELFILLVKNTIKNTKNIV